LFPEHPVAHLRLASAEDAKPDPRWSADVDELAEILKAQGVGVFCIIEMDGARTVYAAGQIDPDGIAGYAARVLAAMAEQG
jgi:hypothetical protein